MTGRQVAHSLLLVWARHCLTTIVVDQNVASSLPSNNVSWFSDFNKHRDFIVRRWAYEVVVAASAWGAVIGQSQGHDVSRRCSNRSFQPVRRGTSTFYRISVLYSCSLNGCQLTVTGKSRILLRNKEDELNMTNYFVHTGMYSICLGNAYSWIVSTICRTNKECCKRVISWTTAESAHGATKFWW